MSISQTTDKYAIRIVYPSVVYLQVQAKVTLKISLLLAKSLAYSRFIVLKLDTLQNISTALKINIIDRFGKKKHVAAKNGCKFRLRLSDLGI